MATILPQRIATNGTTNSTNTTNPSTLRRKSSLLSFPPSRTPSSASAKNTISRVPVPTRPQRNGSTRSVQTPPTASPSSTTRTSSGAAPAQKSRRVRSQYPADSPELHVEYILIASFDIDKGPTMEHQYPGAISGDENMLAELMLPDQAHMRNEDWTIFFLHRDPNEHKQLTEEARKSRKQAGKQRKQTQEREDGTMAAEEEPQLEGQSEEEKTTVNDDDDESDESEEGEAAPPLIYVLNLVNTKQDTSAKRGAVVKAMAICTRHPFLHIYKPLLLLALDEYFKSPVPETLENLYNAVNSMDLSPMPRLSPLEKHILQATEYKDLFIEKFAQMIQQRMVEDLKDANPTSPDSPSRSTTDLTRAGQRYALPRDTHEYETRVMYDGRPIPIRVPTAISYETVGDFSLIKLIQTFSVQHAASPKPFMLHHHLTTSGAFTHPIIVLINAILTQKRVIFLGHNRPSGEVAEAVLAASSLVSGGILRGFTRHAFPYTDLSKVDDLLKVPGFIAGVTNPTFANHPEWWDLLCDIPTGRMKISNRIEQPLTTDGLIYFQQQNPTFSINSSGVGGGFSPNTTGNGNPSDHHFMEVMLRSIASRHGEYVIRSRWRDYIIKFIRIAAAFEESVYGASALHVGSSEADAGAFGVSGHGYVWSDEKSRVRELGANVWRIEGWRNTRSYYSFIQDLPALWGRTPIRSIDISHHMDRLRKLSLPHEDTGKIYIAFRDAVVTYDEICQLLQATPDNQWGLFHLSMGLLHPDREVRKASVHLLERIRGHEAGRHFWTGLNPFMKILFGKLLREVEVEGTDEEEKPMVGWEEQWRERMKNREREGWTG